MSVEQYVESLATPARPGRTEADVQSDIKGLLISGGFGLGSPQLEVPAGEQRRIDVELGATVIEVKKRIETTDGPLLRRHAEQLEGYVRARMEVTGARYNGVLTDGRTWMLFEVDPASGDFVPRSVFTLTSGQKGATLVEWLRSVLATHSHVKPTAKTIEVALGSSSPAYAQDHAYLKGLYAQVSTDPTVKLKRALWARLLRSALGSGFSDTEELFLDHTLLVIEAAVIGHAIMGFSPEEMLADPARTLDGSAFRAAEVNNVIEADFFDWVLATDGGLAFVKRVIGRVATFNWSDVEHDVLKVLYESVIRAETRKSLGEYYTPDWLAQGIVAKCVTQPLEQRVLDAACGSGTFLFAAVRHYLAAADAAGWDNKQALAGVQEHVFGLDIHPVSVILARITYLLALGDRLQGDRHAIEVPIHLGDSIQWSQDTGSRADSISIRVNSDDLAPAQATLLDIAETLVFPLTGIDDAGTFDRLVRDMAALAHQHQDPRAAYPNLETNVLNRYSVTGTEERATLTSTFRLLCDLNAQGRDSIWGYFVRNQVRPLWLTRPDAKVDVLVGNPPWVAYRYMTPAMQTVFKEFSENYRLWHGKAVATHQDLVGLFIARAADLYLAEGGTFGFVTPLAVLSRRQYEGLRAGEWGETLRGRITEMWDLDQVTPRGFFPVPSGVIFGTATHQGQAYNAPRVERGTVADKLIVTGKRDRSGWAATRPNLTFTPTANTAHGNGEVEKSPYAPTVKQGATIVPRYLYFVQEESQAPHRLGLAAGRTTVRSKRSTLEKKPWLQRPSLEGVVESQYVRSVHLGATIAPFRALEPERAVLPLSQAGMMTEEAIDSAPGLNQWWDTASKEWEEHKTGSPTMTLRDRLDFQRGLTAQLDGTRHRVVYTKSGNTVASVRLEDLSIVIDHVLYWMPAKSIAEARYLTAILNAAVTTKAVSIYQSRGLFGARHFDKYVWLLPIPQYDPSAEDHTALASLAEEAEQVAASVDIPENTGFQKARTLVRQALAEAGITERLNVAVAALLAQPETELTVEDLVSTE